MNITKEYFEKLVVQALQNIPERFQHRLQNVDIIIEDLPTEKQLKEQGISKGETLFGLYEGVPQIDRGDGYNFVLPDKITVFRKALLKHCATETELIQEIAATIRHELAHHFGITDERLDELGKY